jgi:CheY-like chemotaxis protein
MNQALVVDDNEVNRILAGRLLSKAGWTVDEAVDGEQALAWLTTHTAKLVLLDISMPTISGQDVCRLIREGELGGAGLKVVAYTAHAMPEQLAQFIADGFDTVLIKPVSRDRVNAMLTDLGIAITA